MKELLQGLDSKTIRQTEGFHQISPDYHIIENISSELSSTVFGQEKAMNQLARAVARSMAGFSDPRRPEMVAMFLGPTGVGKTEAGKALAKHLYPRNWEERFLRIDCTQLQESHSVGRLKGSEPSYVGYGDQNILITPSFLEKGAVILFDEIEKAHPAVWRWLLPVMEEGQQRALVPIRGRGWQAELATLKFNNVYLLMTANIGAEKLHKARLGDQGIGFHAVTNKPDMEKIGVAELRRTFQGMPEFLGRIDATVVFNELERPSYERIFNKFLGEINADQRFGANFLAVTHELRDYILDHAAIGEYGAREIRHTLNEYLVDKASEIKYSGVLKTGQPLVGDVEDGKVIFWTSDLALNNQGHPIEAHAPISIATDGGGKDAGANIGNRPPVSPPENAGEKDIKKPTGNINFYIPMEPGAEIDLAITVRQPGKKDLNQVITGLPLLPNI